MTDSLLALSRSFNGHGEIASEGSSVNGAGLYTWNVCRDDAGRITEKTETINGISIDYGYSYDTMGRLLTVTRDGTLAAEYRYNPDGTRSYEMNTARGIAGRTFAYSDEDHLLTAGDGSYQYDVDGFLTTKTEGTDTTLYQYGSRGELLSVTPPDGRVIEYVNDPLGRRIAKKIDGATVEKYLWQGMTRLLAIYDGADNLIMRFEYADSRMPLSMVKDGTRYYLSYDQVGSLRIIADMTGNVVKRIDYDAFGNILSDSDPGFTVPFGFAGGLHDRDTGLVRFGYRDYDTDTGRWTAKDPIFFDGGDTDLYGYTQNDPVNWIDPYGMFWAEFGQGYSNTIAEEAWDTGETPNFITATTGGLAEVLKRKIENKPLTEFEPWNPWPIEYFLEPYLERKETEKQYDRTKSEYEPCDL